MRRGFTLVELLVVITMIGLLFSFVALIVVQARVGTKDYLIYSHISSVMNAAEIYLQAYEGQFSGVADTGPTPLTDNIVRTFKDDQRQILMEQAPIYPEAAQNDLGKGYGWLGQSNPFDPKKQSYFIYGRLDNGQLLCAHNRQMKIFDDILSCLNQGR